MGSGAKINIPTFIDIGSAIQKLIVEIHRQQGDLISLDYKLFVKCPTPWSLMVRLCC
jgi:hypothetical protein